MLPRIPNQNGAAKIPVQQFGGLDRRAAAANGAICDMTNLTGAEVPVLVSRPARKVGAALTKPRGICAVETDLYYVEAGALYKDGTAAPVIASLPGGTDAERVFAALGKRLLIWPDKLVYDTAAGESTALEATFTATGLVFSDGTYAGESAEKNTITTSGETTFPFHAGDAVTIPACTPTGGVDLTVIVREVDGGGKVLRFYENTFAENGTVSGELTLRRSVPNLDFLCVNENRVWGCKGDTICCSKLGDPANWNVFDGLSTDAWSVETGTAGSFTGCVSFMGYAIFFKEDRVFKVYGNRPSNFELMGSAALGVLPGAGKTMAVAGETLYYLSRAGFVRYNGGYPSAVGDALNAKYTAGAAGSDGRRYFVSALRSDGAREMLAYHPDLGLWFKEDALAATGFANIGSVLYAQTAAANVTVAGAGTPNEGSYERSVTFADFDLQTFGSKYPVRLWLRYELDPLYVTANGVTTDTAGLVITISYNGGEFESVVTAPSGQLHTMYVPVPIRRCDRFRVKLGSNSGFRLYAMEIETRAERSNRKGG